MKADFIKRLSDSASLTDILIQMESFLDDLDIYVFKNWFEGELVDGPNIERHWVSMTLKYNYDQMPDPEGGIRLLKYGALVKFKKAKQEDTEDRKQEDIRNIDAQYRSGIDDDNMDYELNKQRPHLKTVWLVTIKIPRHFIDQLEQMDDLLDSNVDAEHVQAAKDADLQAKDAYKDPMANDPLQTQDETTGEVDDQFAGGGGL